MSARERDPSEPSRVLVVNSGSSSVKYRLFAGPETIARGLIERIGEPDSPVRDHDQALRQVLDELATGGADADDGAAGGSGSRGSGSGGSGSGGSGDARKGGLAGLAAVGHRVVHGGLRFTEPARIDDQVVAAIEELVPLAPLHNPANLAGIAATRALLPDVPQVAVFDTAFHRTLPPEAATYAIDAEVARAHGVHRYGFHGTSHGYVARRTAELLGRDPTELNVITLHLGNGASACAVAGGRSVATSMGLTPLEGLVMGTRSGDLDPAVSFHLHRTAGMSVAQLDELLNQRSGIFGLSGIKDMRALAAARADGDPAAGLAFDVYCHRIKSYVGAYYALLGRLDAVTFTAGVGENSVEVRAAALAGLERLGIVVDESKNRAGAPVISPDGAEVAVCVVPTDEEQEIATQTRAVLAS